VTPLIIGPPPEVPPPTTASNIVVIIDEVWSPAQPAPSVPVRFEARDPDGLAEEPMDYTPSDVVEGPDFPDEDWSSEASSAAGF
jgi:hypothetical protein